MENQKIKGAVVHGATGMIGQALVRCLLEKGIETWAICRPGSLGIQELPTEAKIVECDMCRVADLKNRIQSRTEAFFHLAWAGTIGPERNDARLQTENIRCAVEAVFAARELGCRVFVGAGSLAEYGRIEGKVTADHPCNPESGYGQAKLCAGQMTRLVCNQLGLRHVWARILSVYGPGGNPRSVIPFMLEKLMNGEKPALSEGAQQWDFCYSSDAAEALYGLAVSGRNGAVYPVGSGQTRSLREFFEIIRDTVDPALPLGIGDLPYPPGQIMHLQADLISLQRDTGFEPKVSFREGILRTVEAYRNQRKKESTGENAESNCEEKSQHHDSDL